MAPPTPAADEYLRNSHRRPVLYNASFQVQNRHVVFAPSTLCSGRVPAQQPPPACSLHSKLSGPKETRCDCTLNPLQRTSTCVTAAPCCCAPRLSSTTSSRHAVLCCACCAVCCGGLQAYDADCAAVLQRCLLLPRRHLQALARPPFLWLDAPAWMAS